MESSQTLGLPHDATLILAGSKYRVYILLLDSPVFYVVVPDFPLAFKYHDLISAMSKATEKKYIEVLDFLAPND